MLRVNPSSSSGEFQDKKTITNVKEIDTVLAIKHKPLTDSQKHSRPTLIKEADAIRFELPRPGKQYRRSASLNSIPWLDCGNNAQVNETKHGKVKVQEMTNFVNVVNSDAG